LITRCFNDVEVPVVVLDQDKVVVITVHRDITPGKEKT
jgi:hypothetical protein